jgi:hypothetical protein
MKTLALYRAALQAVEIDDCGRDGKGRTLRVLRVLDELFIKGDIPF